MTASAAVNGCTTDAGRHVAREVDSELTLPEAREKMEGRIGGEGAAGGFVLHKSLRMQVLLRVADVSDMKGLVLKLLGNMPAKELQFACCSQSAFNAHTPRGMLHHPQQRLLAVLHKHPPTMIRPPLHQTLTQDLFPMLLPALS